MVYTDGKTTGIGFSTMVSSSTALSLDTKTVNIAAQGGSIVITDALGNPAANVVSGNFMARKSVLHSIDKVLKFE